MSPRILILPGYGNSGPEHWQSLWEAADPAFRRVEQRDWQRPVCADWLAALEQAVAASGPDTLLVAHSLACLLVVRWAAQTKQRVRAALLVAVPDPQGPSFPTEVQGFESLPMQPLPFRSLLVASSDDPYGSLAHAQACAEAWGGRWVNIGAAGHINSASGLGAWPQGRSLLQSLF